MSISEAFDRIEPQLRRIIREEVKTAIHEASLFPIEAVKTAARNELLTSKQIAEYLKVSPITVYRLRQNRELAFYRVGNRILFSMIEHVQPYLESTSRIRRLSER